VSCDGGWIIGAMFAMDGRRKWMETVDYSRRRKMLTQDNKASCLYVRACVCVCVCVREREKEGE
jgi:hypothetical protein